MERTVSPSVAPVAGMVTPSTLDALVVHCVVAQGARGAGSSLPARETTMRPPHVGLIVPPETSRCGVPSVRGRSFVGVAGGADVVIEVQHRRAGFNWRRSCGGGAMRTTMRSSVLIVLVSTSMLKWWSEFCRTFELAGVCECGPEKQCSSTVTDEAAVCVINTQVGADGRQVPSRRRTRYRRWRWSRWYSGSLQSTCCAKVIDRPTFPAGWWVGVCDGMNRGLLGPGGGCKGRGERACTQQGAPAHAGGFQH
jgi:hypothetical protein